MRTISPRHRAIEHYYQELGRYQAAGVTHEMATRSAFQNLLSTLGLETDWLLIPELALDNGRRPDGTLRDSFFTRGYWEAKDTHDDLPTEVRKKIQAGYPTLNTIFEDTQRAILYQDELLVCEVDLRQPSELADLLTQFFSYTKPEYDRFEKAVEDFKERIPDLARKLRDLISKEHAENPAFQQAFGFFYVQCCDVIGPGVTTPMILDMLVQHLLTERLFRTIFQAQDFTRRNVIAREIETVVAALTSRVFDRTVFLEPLDGFYAAVEAAAATIRSWRDKQEFLRIIYERFFQGYDVKEADTHGIVYTPPEIVDFMRSSVEHVLQTEFGLSLAHPTVQVLDPAAGTGSFIVNLLAHLPLDALEAKYTNGLFANEIMLMPYYIASLNIERTYSDRMERYKPFGGLCFADTLLLEGVQMTMGYMNEENADRVQHEKAAPIMVVMGNPPYNVGQENENDNNKNRRYPDVEHRVRDTYTKDSKASNRNALSDVYVKFFRWATDRLQGRDGIVCLVTNNSFVDQVAFDGMRKHLLQDFTRIYHLDLHGNVRKNPRLSGTVNGGAEMALGHFA